MKKIRKFLLLVPATAVVLLYACGSASNNEQTAAPSKEEQASTLFAAKCGMCHDFKQDKIGPALSGVTARWGNDTGKLKQFIRNSKQVISSGDPYATQLYDKWNRSDMPAFPDMTDAELESLIRYLK
jgi:cytochrome c551/c552